MGGNHPVQHVHSGKVEITAHNHNYAVDPDSINQADVELTHIDLNDHTLEGLRHRNMPLYSVQYHPEAGPGPHDSTYLFHDFRKMMEEWEEVTRCSRVLSMAPSLLLLFSGISLYAQRPSERYQAITTAGRIEARARAFVAACLGTQKLPEPVQLYSQGAWFVTPDLASHIRQQGER